MSALHEAVARAIADELGWSRTQIDAQRAAPVAIRVVLAEAKRSIERLRMAEPLMSPEPVFNEGANGMLDEALAALAALGEQA